jgi:hypothetical protein
LNRKGNRIGKEIELERKSNQKSNQKHRIYKRTSRKSKMERTAGLIPGTRVLKELSGAVSRGF